MKLIKNLMFDVLLLSLYITFFDDKTVVIELEEMFDASKNDTLEGLFNELKTYEGMDGAMEFGKRYGDLVAKGARESYADVITKDFSDETTVEPIKPTEVEPELSVNDQGLRFDKYDDFDSEFISSFIFYPDVNVVSVVFKSGTSVDYSVEGRSYIFEDLKEAYSKGSYYNQALKGICQKVEEIGLIDEDKQAANLGTHYIIVPHYHKTFDMNLKYQLLIYKNGELQCTYDSTEKTNLMDSVVTLPF